MRSLKTTKILIFFLWIAMFLLISCGDKQAEPTDNIQTVETSMELSEEQSMSTEETLPEKERPKVKGIYVTGNVAGSERMEDLIALVDATELNTMVIDVKNDEGEITWKMETSSVQAMGNGVAYIKDIHALMTVLKQHNIYTIARIICFKDLFLHKII